MNTNIHDVGSHISIDIHQPSLTILEATKIMNTLAHCIKKAQQWKDENEKHAKIINDANEDLQND